MKGRINLERAVVLLLDDTPEGMTVLVQILTGFGVKTLHRCRNLGAAKQIASGLELDLAILNANTQDHDAYDFLTWLRRSNLQPNAFTPAILVSGHTALSSVQKARDCGANFIVAKPVSSAVLLDRIMWVAGERRPFVSCTSYFGPDRRFHDIGPPEGMQGRRAGDPPDMNPPSPVPPDAPDAPETTP